MKYDIFIVNIQFCCPSKHLCSIALGCHFSQPGSGCVCLQLAHEFKWFLLVRSSQREFHRMSRSQDGSACTAITVHNFSEKILEKVIHFHVMKLNGGFFLWVGSSPELSNLAVSMSSKYVSYQTTYFIIVAVYCSMVLVEFFFCLTDRREFLLQESEIETWYMRRPGVDEVTVE